MREALSAAGLGVALLALGVGLVHVAETRIDSGVAAMIAGSVPLQIVVWRTLAGERVARGTVLAAAVGLVGLALVVGPDGLAGGSVAVGLLVMLAASLSWSRGLVRLAPALPAGGPVRRDRLRDARRRARARRRSAGRGARRAEIDRAALQPGPLAAWAYLAVVGSVVGFSAYAWLLGNAPISQVVTHQYVNPLVAVVLGAVVLDERPGVATLAGAALIVGAVVVTARHEGRGARGGAMPRPASAVRRETRADPSA